MFWPKALVIDLYCQKHLQGLQALYFLLCEVGVLLLPERRTGTFETGIRVRGGASDFLGGVVEVGLRLEDSATWLEEWEDGDCLTLIGILESRGRLVLPFMERNEEVAEDEHFGEGKFIFRSPADFVGELTSSSEPTALGLSGSKRS